MELGLLLLCGAVIFLLIVIIFRAIRIKDRSETNDIPGIDGEKAERAAQSLSAMIRFRTVSSRGDSRTAMRKMADYLRSRYAETFKTLTVEDAGENILLRWRGASEDADPVLFCANTDVVSADGVWEYDPFSGEIAENMVWGRGAIESKGVLCALMEAVEGLIKNSFVPSRDIYIAIASDAESDNAGHKELAEIMRKRGIRFAAVFGKGNCISRDILPVGRPQAIIGVAEKGRMKIRLYAEDKGGRTGTPPQYTVIGRLCEAICRTEYRTQPVRKSVVLRDMVAGLAPYLPFGMRILAANLWLFESSFFRSMRRFSAFSSMLRTTFAVTEIKAGSAENRLPSSAEAILHVRTIHGDSCSDICRFLMHLIDSTGVQAEVIQADEATQVSPYRGKAYAKLKRALTDSFDKIAAVPGIIADNSSLNAYQQYTEGIYRITPFVLTEDEISTIHSTNERISIEELGKAVIFYEKLIEKVAG